jgi:NAD(P)-dependent dehydrogenase (short-subunit alcohol dehydrogenase family)
MKTGLAGEIVLITGATRDHDRASALAFAEEGAPLLLCTRQSMELLEETAHLATLLLSVCCSPCLGSVLHARRRLPRLSRACLQPQGHAAAVRQPMGGRYGGRALSTGASWGGTR